MDSLTSENPRQRKGAPDSFRHRYKPRASARVQAGLAGAMWLVAGTVLGVRGAGWLIAAHYALLLLTLALVLGAVKYRYVIAPTASKSIERILLRGTDACAGGFLSWRSWLFVLGMMGAGYLLRLSPIPRPVLGVLYVTVALALLGGALSFWRTALDPRC